MHETVVRDERSVGIVETRKQSESNYAQLAEQRQWSYYRIVKLKTTESP